MKYVSFKEYQDAKMEIIGGVKYNEDTIFPNQYGMSSKTYCTESGNFYEVTDPNTGITEFWSTKHSQSRYYNGQTPEGVEAEESTQQKPRKHRFTYNCSLNEEKQRELQMMADKIFKYGTVTDFYNRIYGHEPPEWWENNGETTFKVEKFKTVWLVGLTGAMVTGITEIITY